MSSKRKNKKIDASKYYDLDVVKSLKMNKKNSTLEDWKKIKDKLEKFVRKKEDGKIVYPIKNLYSYFMDTTDISEKMATTAILYLLSSATRRDQQIEFMQGRQRLNIWTILVGQSSITRKTTTERKISRLLNDAGVPRLTQNFTGPAIINVLRDNPNGYLIKSEMSRFLKSFQRDYNAGLPESMCQLYDCDDRVEYYTRTNQREIVENPFVVMWGATTPYAYPFFRDEEFIQGFFQRFLFCMETEKNRYNPISFGASMSEIHRNYSAELMRTMREYDVSLIRTDENSNSKLWTEYQNYVTEIIDLGDQFDNSPVFPYWGRTTDSILKIAGVLQLAKDSFLDLPYMETEGENSENYIMCTKETIQLAIEIMLLYEQEFLELIKRKRFVSESREVKDDNLLIQKIKDIVNNTDEKVMSTSEILSSSDMLQAKVRETLGTLVTRGDFKIVSRELNKYNLPGKTGGLPNIYYIANVYEKDQHALCAYFYSKDASDVYKCDDISCKLC